MAEQVLTDAVVWRLRQESWDVVGQNLTAMELALSAGNPAALRLAVANLEMAGPHRIGGLEDWSMLPLSEEFRERVDELIHTLGETSPTTQRTGPAPGRATSGRPPASGAPVSGA